MTTPSLSPDDDGVKARQQRVYWLGLLIGLVLTVIGVRFFVVPEGASYTFGVAHPPKGDELHHVIAIRDIWLGLMAMAFAILREWRALAVWLAGAGLTCFVDALVVNQSTANAYALSFHVLSGVLCLVVARGAWILSTATQSQAK